MRQLDLTGQRFGRLVALAATDGRRHANIIWECACDCGATKKVASPDLRLGKARSCGCLRSEVTARRNRDNPRPRIVRSPCATEDCERIAWANTLCRSHYMKDWYRKNPRPQRASQMKLKYGLTQEAFDILAGQQGGMCAICKGPPNRRGLFVDHDHACCPGQRTCGKCIRGLLCNNCNFLIGLAKEDREVLRSAAEYIEVWTTS